MANPPYVNTSEYASWVANLGQNLNDSRVPVEQFRVQLSDNNYTTLANHLTGWVNVKTFGSDGAALVRAAADAATANSGLLIAHPIVISTAVGTVSVPVRFEGGGRLVLNAGGSVTLSGAMDAPLTQIFDTSGGGTVTFSAKVREVVPQWWGADTAAVQSSLNAASLSGARVFIPPGTTYTLASLTLPANVVVEDWSSGAPFVFTSLSGVIRRGYLFGPNSGADNALGRLSVYSEIAAAPAADQGYPRGHDLHLFSGGPGDLYLDNSAEAQTCTTSVTPGTTTVVVGSTANLSHAAAVTLIIEPGAANEETIAQANWSVVDPTHLQILFAGSHTQPYTIHQRGAVYALADVLQVNGTGVVGQFQMVNTKGTPVFYFRNPSNTSLVLAGNSDAARIYGGATGHLYLFSSNTTTRGTVEIRDDSGADNHATAVFDTSTGTLELHEQASGSASTLKLSNPTNTSLKFLSQSDVGRIYGGGTSGGLIVYGSQGATGTTGNVRFRDNATDNNESFLVIPGAAGGVKIGGGTQISKVLLGQKGSWALGTVGAAGQVTTTLTVTGAVTTGTPVVRVSPTSTLAAPLVAYGYVSGADTVTLVVVNGSAAGVAGGTVTFNVEVVQ